MQYFYVELFSNTHKKYKKLLQSKIDKIIYTILIKLPAMNYYKIYTSIFIHQTHSSGILK